MSNDLVADGKASLAPAVICRHAAHSLVPLVVMVALPALSVRTSSTKSPFAKTCRAKSDRLQHVADGRRAPVGSPILGRVLYPRVNVLTLS